eukprot:403355373
MEKKNIKQSQFPPAWNTFRVEGVTFCSEFDSGNLYGVIPAPENKFNGQLLKYDLFICDDAFDVIQAPTYRCWFHFYVTGVPRDTLVIFTIKNMMNQSKLFSYGMKPVFKILPKSQLNWEPIQGELTYQKYSKEHFEISWTHFFQTNSLEQTFFAFCEPFSYQECQIHSGEVPSSHVLNGIIDFLSDEDDPVSMALLNLFVVKIIPMLNPDGVVRGHYRLDNLGNNLNRFYEDPKFEQQPSIYAAKHVIKSIYDQRPQNLFDNNYFNKLDIEQIQGGLYLYMDLHAHAGKRGCFIYGNSFEDFDYQVKTIMYPKMISCNTLNFDFLECNFTEKLMKRKDKITQQDNDIKTREGAGRVAIHKDCGNLIYSYTMECNYCCGTKINPIQRRMDSATGKQIKDTEAVLDPNSLYYQQYYQQLKDQAKLPDIQPQVPFNSTIMGDIGRASMIAILDLVDRNPQPRVYGPMTKTIVDEVLNYAQILQLQIEELKNDKKPKKSTKKSGKKGTKKSKKSKKNETQETNEKTKIDQDQLQSNGVVGKIKSIKIKRKLSQEKLLEQNIKIIKDDKPATQKKLKKTKSAKQL